jgi:glycosyltransferase
MRGDSFKIVRYWQSGPYNPKKFYHGWMPPHPTFFVRRSVYEKYGLFNIDLGTAADYELMLRFLLKHRTRCTYIPEVLVCMRVGGASNRSLAARLKANRMDRKAWEVNGLRPYPWTIAMKPLRKIPQWWCRPMGVKGVITGH